MRLTLRTLLAWLDDTLPPSQVREIGKQVSSSPFARDLVERIHRVTRQRRYTVPGKTGPEATDPNVVAGYVDNDLSPEQVAEYEKKCLTSDVNLAEVACVHQILSLLGQKVQVPAEVKSRMYHLVKGRESVPPPQANGAAARPPEPVTKPIQPWVAPEPPRRHWAERFGPVAACIALIGLLSWSAYQSLGPTREPEGAGSPAGLTAGDLAPAKGGVVATPTPMVVPAPEPGAPPAPAIPGEAVKPADRDTAVANAAKPAEPAAPTAPEPSSPAPKPTAVPPGAIGVVDRAPGILLRFNTDKQMWEKLAAGSPLTSGDRLLSLAPFRARVVIGQAPVTLVGETAIRLTGKAAGDPPSFELADGQALVEATATPSPLRVEFADHTATIDRPSHGTLGLERLSRWVPGNRPEAPAALEILASDGDVTAAMGTAKQVVTGPGRIVADASGTFHLSEDKSLPPWMTETEPSPKDQKLGEQFFAKFAADRPIIADIVMLTEDESAVVRKFAIQGLKAMGDLSYLMPILGRAKDPSARASTVAAVRAYVGLGPQALRRLRQGLDEDLGPEVGKVVEELLIGYTAGEAAQPEVIKHLVDLLSPRDQSLVVRELALDNLKSITGRDDQGYDPEKADEKGYNAWKSLLSKGELKPAAKRKGG
jgi:hypothetical protein